MCVSRKGSNLEFHPLSSPPPPPDHLIDISFFIAGLNRAGSIGNFNASNAILFSAKRGRKERDSLIQFVFQWKFYFFLQLFNASLWWNENKTFFEKSFFLRLGVNYCYIKRFKPYNSHQFFFLFSTNFFSGTSIY